MKKTTVVIVLLICMFIFGNESSPKLGLVLSGGGAKGIAHIGVLKVLEEYNITPDYITGTSMGSIIGALYSLGYTASEMEEIILSQDWNELLLDYVPLNRIALEEKDEKGRYAGSFPIEDYKITLPKGLVAGQNVSQLLSKLTIFAHQVEDFDNLPIPFLCIATDIETGEAVVLDSGYLPEAVRASMSIPSMFTPVEYDDRLLVDGGLVRNFPVSDCVDMGADIIIGVNVGSGLLKRDKLNSLVRIMEQSIAFQGAYSTEEERKLADILIEPEVSEYQITEFTKGEELIALGEDAARKHLAELDSLVENYELKSRRIPMANPDKVYIENIRFEGLEKVSKNLVIGKMSLDENSRVSVDDIDTAISKLYGSGYFERVVYKLEWGNNGYILRIRVLEKNTTLFRFGFHYDSDNKSSLLLNTTFRNAVVMGSKVSIDLGLGDTRSFRWSEFVHTGWKPGFGLGWDIYYDKFDFIYRIDGEQIASLNIQNTGSIMDFSTIFSNSFTAGMNIDLRKIKTTGEIIPEEWETADEQSLWLRNAFYIRVDSRDKAIYPTGGISLYLEVKNFYCQKQLEYVDENFTRIFLNGEVIIPICKRLSWSAGGFLGIFDTDELPNEEVFYLGGFSAKDNARPFAGLNFGEIAAKEAYTGTLKLQYEPWDGFYLSARYDLGTAKQDFLGFPADELFMQGGALSFGMNTPLGPIEYTLMYNDQHEGDLRTYVKIGYDLSR